MQFCSESDPNVEEWNPRWGNKDSVQEWMVHDRKLWSNWSHPNARIMTWQVLWEGFFNKEIFGENVQVEAHYAGKVQRQLSIKPLVVMVQGRDGNCYACYQQKQTLSSTTAHYYLRPFI
jgi:hypothetical protein